MSELMNSNVGHSGFRWQLLTTVSAFALSASLFGQGEAQASDADRPTVWIELGGQLSHLQDSQEAFTPSFETMRPAMFSPSRPFEKAPVYSIDETGRISLQPEGSNWVFAASVRYGRSVANRHVRQQTYPNLLTYAKYPNYPSALRGTAVPHAARFADTNVRNSEQHAVLDFQAGKDVGLGMFGRGGSSTISVGVRFAQFIDKSNIALKSDPDWRFQPEYLYSAFIHILQPYHSNAASLTAERSFHGVGPSLSWNASAALAGDPQDAELTLDWGVNVAVLFGRQKARTQHYATVRYNEGGGLFSAYGSLALVSQTAPPANVRSRSVTVPNVGGTVGFSVKYPNAKVSLGYRADFFFGAMDGGIDVRRTEDVGFHGPYASVSIGLGD